MNILKEATKNTNRKELAHYLGKSEKTIGEHINGNVEMTVINQLKVWCEYGDADMIMRKVCADQGGIFVKLIERASYDDIKIVPVIIKEFSDFMSETAQSYADGEVTAREYKRLKKEWNDCHSAVLGMFAGIEKDLSKE